MSSISPVFVFTVGFYLSFELIDLRLRILGVRTCSLDFILIFLPLLFVSVFNSNFDSTDDIPETMWLRGLLSSSVKSLNRIGGAKWRRFGCYESTGVTDEVSIMLFLDYLTEGNYDL